MPLLPSSVLAYAWMVHFNVNIAGPAIMLVVAGFSCAWIYSSTLAYIVDANTGRSSTAVAANSSWRGIMGLIIAEISVPLQVRPTLAIFSKLCFIHCLSQNALGDGALYSIWAGVLVSWSSPRYLSCIVVPSGAHSQPRKPQPGRRIRMPQSLPKYILNCQSRVKGPWRHCQA